MRVPRRKAGEFTFAKIDPLVTAEKLAELQADLLRLKNQVQPQLASEVKRLALMGDFSENAAYQIAKGRLRGINQRILDIQKQIDCAEIINTNIQGAVVKIGSLVTVEINNQSQQYRVLGSLETNPGSGVISYNSPLGQALLNKQAGDIVKFKSSERELEYKILKVE